jgi:hypothetical protein
MTSGRITKLIHEVGLIRDTFSLRATGPRETLRAVCDELREMDHQLNLARHDCQMLAAQLQGMKGHAT